MMYRFSSPLLCSSARTAIGILVILFEWEGAVLSGSSHKSVQSAKFQSFNEFLRRNDIQVGDLFETNTKRDVVAVKTNQLVLIPGTCPLSSVFGLRTIDLPTPQGKKYPKIRKVYPRPDSGYDRDRVVAVVRRLQDKALHYRNFRCNRLHWRNYILYGKTYKSWIFGECPLARPIVGVAPQDIEDGTFAFHDSCGQPVRLWTWEAYHRRYGDEYLDCGCGPMCMGTDYHPNGKCIFAD